MTRPRPAPENVEQAIKYVDAEVADVGGPMRHSLQEAEWLVDEVRALRADLTCMRARTLVLHGYVERLRDSKHRTCDCPERVLFFMENEP